MNALQYYKLLKIRKVCLKKNEVYGQIKKPINEEYNFKNLICMLTVHNYTHSTSNYTYEAYAKDACMKIKLNKSSRVLEKPCSTNN